MKKSTCYITITVSPEIKAKVEQLQQTNFPNTPISEVYRMLIRTGFDGVKQELGL